MRRILLAATLGVAGQGLAQNTPSRAESATRPVVVGSKPFGESYLLAEIFAQVLERAGLRVDRKSTRLNSSHGYQSRMPSSA